MTAKLSIIGTQIHMMRRTRRKQPGPRQNGSAALQAAKALRSINWETMRRTSTAVIKRMKMRRTVTMRCMNGKRDSTMFDSLRPRNTTSRSSVDATPNTMNADVQTCR